MTKVNCICGNCKKQFTLSLGRYNRGQGNKFCSHRCYAENLKGKPMLPVTVAAIRKSHIGRKNTPETIQKMKLSAYKRLLANGWDGMANTYEEVHRWVKKNRGKPSLCEHCGTTNAKKFEWANVSKQYQYKLDDWLRLCTSCHHKFDRLPERRAIKTQFPKPLKVNLQ